MIRGGFWGGAWGLSWGGAWGEAWLLLNQPYQELSLKGQVFVRSYLSSIHSVEVAERIVAVAALNNISVVDAEVVVAAKQAQVAHVKPVEAKAIAGNKARIKESGGAPYRKVVERTKQLKPASVSVKTSTPIAYSVTQIQVAEATTRQHSAFVVSKQVVVI